MQIMNNMAPIYGAEGVELMPGPNTVPDEIAKKFLANKGVKHRIATGKIVAQGQPEAPKMPGADPTQMTVEEIETSEDRDRLTMMASGDGRKPEVKAAKARLEELDKD